MAASEYRFTDYKSEIDRETDMRSTDGDIPAHNEFPARVDLLDMLVQQPLPRLAPGLIDPASMAGDEPTKKSQIVLDCLNAAIAGNDAEAIENCFVADHAYWKDQLALTYHLRTFRTPGVIAASLLETNKLRAIKSGIAVNGGAMFMSATPVLVSGPRYRYGIR
jgi:hypothetical protein